MILTTTLCMAAAASAYFLEKNRDDIGRVKAMIDRNSRDHGWLILATHDICDSPTPYGCKPGFFEEVVRYAIGSGASVLPVIEALAVARGKAGVPLT